MSEIAVGQPVELSDGQKGVVRFVGRTNFAAGDWVGVELDEENGKNDGSVQGERYFDCAMRKGMFVRPLAVTVLQAAPRSAAPPRRRPSSVNVPGSGRSNSRSNSTSDPSMSKRMSLNTASPSPGPRVSRPASMSIPRSPNKSPVKQLGSTAASSASNSRTGTPANTRARGGRPSFSGTQRTSMGPPALPSASRGVQRTTSTSSSSATRSAGASRPLSGRLSTTGRGGFTRTGGRVMSGDSLSGNEAGFGSRNRSEIASPVKSDDEQVTSPVRSRTNALEKLTSGAKPNPSPTTVRAGAASTRVSLGTTRPAANNALGRENEDLKAKLKVLERKRLEDRERMKELEKTQEQKEKFELINKKIEQKFQDTKEENLNLRKQVKEAEDRLESIEALQAEHDSIMELATLDREMAEETAEVLKVELDALKEKTEELELEVEVLREENAEYEKGMTAEDLANTNWIQLERNNERLREALIRLRDISREQDEDAKAQIKTLQKDLEAFDAIKEEFQISKEKVIQGELQIEDLREQLNNALGSEEMIEQLSEEKMNHEEHIKELKAAIADLEALRDINDEIEINRDQNEREMQDEIDHKDGIIAELHRKAREREKIIEDREYDLSRFGALLVNLQTDLEDMRSSHAVNEAESEQLNSKSRAMMDLNLKLQLSAAKTQVKTIELELQKMDAAEAQQHLKIVKLFLPETYETDKNSVLALLRFGRLAFKANLLHGFIKERVAKHSHPGHEDDTIAGCDAMDKLTWVSSMCDRFVNVISHCSLDEFAKYDGALFELEPVERALNGWIDGLRRDELKEKQCAAELSRTIALMSHLGEVHISDGLESFADNVQMKTLLMQSHLESAATTFGVIKDLVTRAVPVSDEDGELADHFSKKSDAVISQTRSAKVIVGKAVRSLEELKARSLCLMPETGEVFEQCEAASLDLADMSRKIGIDLHALTSEEGRAEAITYSDVQSTVRNTAMTSFSSSETDLFSTYLSKLRVLTGQIADLAAVCADLSQTQEFERSEAPWRLRAEELKAIKVVPVDAEEELRLLKEHYSEARREIAVREDSLSTATLRIETLEARMKDASAKASLITSLEAQIAEAQSIVAQHKEDIDKQDRELKTLETDRDKWKKLAGDNQAFGNAAGTAGAKAGQERAVATAREMDALKNDIASLQAAVRYLREDNRRARLTEQHKFDWLAEPLKKPAPVTEQRKALVVAEGKDALGELLKMAISAKVYDLKALPEDKMAWRPAKITPQYHAAKQAEDFATWKSWHNSVLQKAQVVLNAQSGRRPEYQNEEMRKAAAKLRIRLPDMDGKVVPGGSDVQIVGSREWEGLQGRLATV
ncbi:CAP-Gly domain-containing protein [Pseudomassariella vexata]|uniref:CAP-Gly domain-containing protein n=1 Tax=Pseudomassariella vexata TaxID=1141098 RepID=A0A1Y2D752_9PEZI|nr:CAP-Gly domain-containing protein [Pseudomassariella vexata]ORY55109.1 CAP-Gly domain-containing protein [Pseudomassariella vexata]